MAQEAEMTKTSLSRAATPDAPEAQTRWNLAGQAPGRAGQ
jgi:hypothetical protein